MSLLRRIRTLFRRRRFESELAEELRAHLEMQAEANRAEGMDADEAGYAARRQFGHLDGVKETVREQRGWVWLDQTAQELRYAVRTLRKNPGFTAVVVLTLALGIGGTTSTFSIVNAVVLRPLAFPDSARLVDLRVVLPALAHKYPTLPVNVRFYEEWRKCPAFTHLALVDRSRSTLTGNGEPVRISSVYASTNLFATLGVEPALGRSFEAKDGTPGKSSVGIISHRFWRQQLSGDPAIIGRTLMIDQRPVTVIGVLPVGFRFPQAYRLFPGQRIQHGEPAIYMPRVIHAKELNQIIGGFNYEAIGRLAAGVSPATATAQLNVVAARLARLSHTHLVVRGAIEPLHEAVVGPVRGGLYVLLAAIVAVLLLACLNVSMLALTRAEHRRHESAVRSALGATRARLIRQTLVESLVLSVAGGGLGCLAAFWGLNLVLHFAPGDLPQIAGVRIDPVVLLFAVAVTLGTAVFTGFVPSWRTAHADALDVRCHLAGRTATSGPGARRFRRLLVGIETGVSVLLLVTAALLVTSFVRIVHIKPGFHAPHALWTKLAVPDAKYPTDAARDTYRRHLLTAVKSVPGVTSAAISNALPLQGQTWIDAVWTPGDSRPLFKRPQANVRFISPGFFSTLGIPVVAGRIFDPSDRGRRVAMLSAQLAARLWPGLNPIGRKVVRGNGKTYVVIGVLGDVRANATQRPVPMFYLPYWEWTYGNEIFVVKLHRPASAVVPALRRAIRGIDAEVPVAAFRTMDDILVASLARRRFELQLVGAFALVALVLAALGIYGVTSHSVSQRTRELGIRVAFGAEPAALRRMVLRQSFRPIACGLVAGIGAAMAGDRVLKSLLFETSPLDPLSFITAVGVLVLVAVLACWLPARRATKVDPVITLRAE